MLQALFARCLFQKTIPFFHHIVVFFQNPCISILLIHRIRDQDTRIAPADRGGEHFADKARPVVRWCDIGKPSIRILSVSALRKEIAVNRITIHQCQPGIHKETRIARPSGAFPCRAVGRDATEVTLLTPDGIFYQLVDQWIAACKCCGLLHVGIDCMGGKAGML